MEQAQASCARSSTPENFDQLRERRARAAATSAGSTRATCPTVLEEALLGLSEGEISQPVRGPSGIHIFMVHERQSGANAVPPFEEMRAQIQSELLDKAMLRQEELFLEGCAATP